MTPAQKQTRAPLISPDVTPDSRTTVAATLPTRLMRFSCVPVIKQIFSPTLGITRRSTCERLFALRARSYDVARALASGSLDIREQGHRIILLDHQVRMHRAVDRIVIPVRSANLPSRGST